MNRVIVLKDVAYAAKVGGGVIATAKEVNSLAPGAIAFLTDKGTVITAANAATVLPDVKDIMIIGGRTSDNQVLNQVPRKIAGITRGNYRAFVKPVYTIGGTTAATALTFVDNTEASIRVTDITFTSRFAPRAIAGSVFKKPTMTIEQAIDEMVKRLNTSSFIVATKVGSTPNFGITITPKEEDVAIDAHLSGSLEGGVKTLTTAPVYGIGRGIDVLQMEKDASVEEGNGNYIEYTADWYKRNMEASTTGTYDVITLAWEGSHSSPSRSHSVMRNTVAIATLSTAVASTTTKQDTANIMALLALIFPTAYSGTTAAETATDDGTDNDGVSGN